MESGGDSRNIGGDSRNIGGDSRNIGGDSRNIGGSDPDDSTDEILHKLRIISAVKDNDKLSTQRSLSINRPNEVLVWLKRAIWGENRESNLKYVENTFMEAFGKINQYIKHQSSFINNNNLTLEQTLEKTRNSRKIVRLQSAIINAKDKYFPKTRVTYSEDIPHNSKILSLAEKVEDQLTEINVSIEYLANKDASPIQTR